MKTKVATLTKTFLQSSGGNVEQAAALLANFNAQQAVRPFLQTKDSPIKRFGNNVRSTLEAIKLTTRASGTPADMMRRSIIVAGAEGPLAPEQLTLAELSRLCGYGNNPQRLLPLYQAKSGAQTAREMQESIQLTARRKTRKDKLTGDAIWTKVWHEFTEVKKGQQFRSKMMCTNKVLDPATGRMVWKSQWLRHPKRYMSHKISEIHAMVLKWQPYLKWRAIFLKRNPNWPSTWHVGEKRLYKEKCFCIDQKVF